MAELLASEGYQVTLVTPDLCVASWTENTLDQGHIEKRLIQLGVEILPRHSVETLDENTCHLIDLVTEKCLSRSGTLIPVTMRLPKDALFSELASQRAEVETSGIETIQRIGDCFGPATIAAAVYEGHRFARELETPTTPGPTFKTVRYELELGGAGSEVPPDLRTLCRLVGRNAMPQPGLQARDNVVRPEQLLRIIRATQHRIVVELLVPDLHHVQDDLRILWVIFLPTVVQGFAGTGQCD